MYKVLLWRLLRTNEVVVFFSVISFIIGSVLSSLLGEFLASPVDRSIQIAVFATLLTILLYLAREFRELKESMHRQRLAVQVRFSSQIDQDKNLYDPVNEMIARSKHSIRVIGMFRPYELTAKSGRKNYYDVINDKIDLMLNLNRPFIYERIVQVEHVTSGQIQKGQIDPITFEHCSKIIKWKQNQSPVTINLKQIPNILGALSFLVVDNEFFVLVIPDTIKDSAGQLKLEGLQLGINFEDSEGVLTAPMNSFFSRLLNEADSVLKLEPN